MRRVAVRMGVGAGLLLAMPCLAQAPAATATPTAAPAEPKMRCKRYVETGSLARVNKVCHTDAEWRQMAEAEREGARNMVNNTLSAGSLPQ